MTLSPNVRLAPLALWLLTGAAHAACSKPFTMALETWPPYVYADAAGKPAGLDVELAQAVFREAGCTLIITGEVPRKRRLKMYEDGELTLLLAASDTPEREKTSYFTLPYRHEITALVALTSKAPQYADIHHFADLGSRKVLLLSPNTDWYGQDYADNLPAMRASASVAFFEDFQQGIRMLKAGHGDIMLGDLAALLWEARKQDLSVQELPMPVVSDEVHFMLSRRAATDTDIATLNAAISRLEKNGVLPQIRNRYGVR
ncbi:polar amino acid transport system substrate-binding protein [Silvimonas terrae]|uniref:Polar amino acid transport system substrate-binding protein n=1 Tax=Silvimonas terrae TaxID=300266 RepID=A0A840R7U8_9NEIS|nr:transporter substrate-binding domain-containing protein [Silvimonas terrae]MBB5189355.1 polar amino acid transport system substrate-binding protein [Silvimonas terrae]